MIISVFMVFASCSKLEDLNQNTKDPSVVTGETLFTGAQKNLFDQMVSTNVNNNVFRLFAQYWTETTYYDEAKYNLTNRSIPDNHWDRLYLKVLKNLDQASKFLKENVNPLEDPAILKNKLAIIEALNVYTYSVLVESFGDVPYSGAINTSLNSQALNIDIPLPKYDKGLDIYVDLITRINLSISNMDAAAESFGTADNMYGGDVASWIKFANSLKLRMGMLLSDVNPTLAKTTVEAAAPNVFSSNADNARIVYLSSSPNANPIYVDLVSSGRHDFVPANTIVDAMNGLNDPRRPFFFTLKDTSTVPGTYPAVYIGGTYGIYNRYSKFSHVAGAIQDPTFEGTILDYAEVEFLLAEAAENSFAVGGTAESHYNAGITASITYWGGTVTDANTYLAQASVAYTTATGTFKQKIGTQKWIAMYNRGFEGWQSWRKFDFPVLVAPPGAFSDVPVRYTFPIAEQTLNGVNFTAAAASINLQSITPNGDAVSTKLFWDKY